ncbi:MAG TPA: hypothetical protein V6C99_01595 [Oculatellaceae cyanobacterium]|jgi:hypothetical protein
MPSEPVPSESKSLKKRARPSQERLMVLFTLFFIIGILLLVFIPEDHPARGIAMSLYCLVVFWVMFRFGI